MQFSHLYIYYKIFEKLYAILVYYIHIHTKFHNIQRTFEQVMNKMSDVLQVITICGGQNFCHPSVHVQGAAYRHEMDLRLSHQFRIIHVQ